MKDHQEVILQLKLSKGRYWMQDIGGKLCTKMCMVIVNPMMHAKEQAN
jgi:hypothetical protein